MIHGFKQQSLRHLFGEIQRAITSREIWLTPEFQIYTVPRNGKFRSQAYSTSSI